jgi:FkbM family methyltransferase
MFFIDNRVRRNVLVSTDHGMMLVNRFDCNHEQVGHGQWLLDHGSASSIEAQETVSCLQNISSPVIFDVGSNIGTYSTWLTKILPQSKIYCFEPQRIVFQMLCANMMLNNFDNCFAHNIAIGNKDDFIVIDEPDYEKPEDFGIFSLVEDKIFNKSNKKTVIPIMKIDTFVETYCIEKLNFIKIDVEGMDMDVLKGAQKTIQKYNPFIFIEHSDNRKSILNEITDYLSLTKYEFKVIGNNVLAKPK